MTDHREIQLEAVKHLREEITINDYGLPVGIYRLDLLPFHDYKPQVHQSTTPPSSFDATGVEAQQTYSDPFTQELAGAGIIKEVGGVPNADTDADVDTEVEVEVDEAPTALSSTPIEYRIAGFPADEIRQAFMPLEYHEGFPAFRNGDPFWLQLIYEPQDAYDAFHRYLQMSATTPADSVVGSVVSTSPALNAGATGFRSVALLAAQIYGHDHDLIAAQEQLKNWSELFYWEWRAKSYDHFRVARHRQQQEIRAIETQDTHYGIARRLTAKIMNYIDNEEDFMDQMTPKVAFDGLKLAMSAERIAAGLPAAGPLRAEDERPVTSMEMTMRRIGQSSRNEDEIHIDEGSVLLQRALDNPADIEVFQEMILRVHTTTPAR